MRKLVRLSVIRNENKIRTAKDMRRKMFNSCRRAADYTGDDIAGYALVCWSKSGEMVSGFNTGTGDPIGAGVAPTLIHDVLNRHIAVDTAQSD